MTDVNVRIDFSTNADIVKKQIDAAARSADNLVARGRLANSLDANKASAKALTGQLSAKKAIFQLDKQIDSLAARRAKLVSSQYNFGNQQKYVQGLIKQNEVMRIQRKIMDDNATAMVNLGKNTQWAGRQLVVGFTVPLTIAAGAAMKAFSDLEKEMIRFKRVYGDVTTSPQELDQVTKKVEELAVAWTKYGVAVSDTIDLAAQAAGAGFQGNQLTAQIDAANKLSVLGEVDKQKAMKTTIAIQSTFGQSNQELAQTINYLNQLENQTMVTLDDMTTAIPKAGSVVKGLGGSVKDLGTFLAAMEEGGVGAGEAANALKSGLGSLLNPSKAANEQLKAIGLNIENLWEQSEKNGRGVIFVVEQLSSALDELGQTQKQRVIEELFGKNQFARMNALLSNINTGNQVAQAKTVAGASQLEAAITAQQELGKLAESNLTKFQSAIEKLKASIAPIGEQIMGALTPVINFVTKIMDKFNNLPDFMKQIGMAIVAGVGIITPVFLMLLGQIQNLIGNGMKFVNGLKNWGKNTKWVTAENLTLADALGQQDAELIAQNKLLMQNTQLWQKRNAATGVGGNSTAIVGGRVNAPLKTPKVPRKFSTGGSVGGSGSGDTVPAMLTPGEFVVNKKATGRFGSLLHAINSGSIPGFSQGIVPGDQSVNWAHISKDMPFDLKKVTASKGAIDRFIGAAGELGVDPSQYLKMVSKAVIPLPAWANQALKPGHGGVAASSLLPFFNPNTIGPKNQPFSRTLHGMGAARLAKSGETLNAQRFYYEEMTRWLTSKGSNTITDKDLARRSGMIVADMRGNPKYRAFGTLLGNAFGTAGQVRQKNASELAQVAIKSGRQDLLPSLGLKWMGSGKGAMTNKFPMSRFYGRPAAGIRSLFGGFATGGIVPGSGNKDTVPAMLTPGESVINKKATQKFGPLLRAINSGGIRMLVDGEVGVGKKDKGYRGPLDSTARRSLLDDAREGLEQFLLNFQQTFNIADKKMKKIREQVIKDFDEQTRMSHIARTTDEEGNKIYPHEVLVGASRRENQGMEDLSRKGAQAVMSHIATLGKDETAVKARTAIVKQLADGEHIVLRAERDLLQQMIMEAEQLKVSNPALYGAMPDTLKGKQGQAFAAGLSTNVAYVPTGKAPTQENVKDARKLAASTKGATDSMDDLADSADENTKANKQASAQNKAFGVMMGAQMLEMTGITGKMGAFGDALITATSALSMMAMTGMEIPGLGGLGGRLGKGRIGGATSKVTGALSKSIKAGGIAGLGVGLGSSLIGGVIGDGQNGTRDTAGKAVSWAGIGAGIGMMLPGGPLTSALGAAIGGLAGLAVQTKANADAMKELRQSVQDSSSAQSKIGDELADKFNLGSGKSFEDMFKSAQIGGSEEQKDLYKQVINSLDEGGAFKSRIDELNTASRKGLSTTTDLKFEIANMVTDLQGRGVDDASIETIVQAFASQLDDSVKAGLDSSKFAKELLASNNAVFDLLNSGGGTGAQLGALSINAIMSEDQKRANLDTTSDTWLDDMAEIEKRRANYEKAAESNSKHFEDVLNMASQNLKDAQASGTSTPENNMQLSYSLKEAAENYRDFIKGLARPAEYLIEQGQGRGIMTGEAEDIVAGAADNQFGEDMKDDTAVAMAELMKGGIDLQWASKMLAEKGAAATAAAIQSMANNVKAQADLQTQKAALDTLSNTLKQAQKDLKEARRVKNEAMEDANKNYSAGGITFNKGDISKRQVALQKIMTKVEVSQIVIEKRVVAEFAAKFNKAFNAGIDSFADAGFAIDKIGRKIESIQRTKIGPLQDKADKLGHANELDQREIDAIQKKQQDWEEEQQKRIDETNDAYEDQAKALEKIRQQNEYIAQQQQSNIALADALSKGDLAGAAGAMVQAAQNQSQFASQLADQRLSDGKDQADDEMDKRRKEVNKQIEAIQDRIDARTKSIQKIEDKIYNINLKQVKPLERRQAAMQAMLSAAQALAEEEKNNAEGRDAENDAREAALLQAEEAVTESQNQLTLRQQILKTWRDEKQRIRDLAPELLGHGKNLKKALGDAITTVSGQIDVIDGKIQTLVQDAANITQGIPEAINKWSNTGPGPGSSMEIVKATVELITGKKFKKPMTAAEQAAFNKSERLSKNLATGGSIDGSGGRDSVNAMLTPGEYVMRKSAVDRIGVNKLDSMNRGMSPDYSDEVAKYATGGEVKPGNFVDDWAEKTAKDIINNKKYRKVVKAAGHDPDTGPVSTGEGPSDYVPSGPIPGLSKTEPGPSGYPAESASWIGARAVRIMRYVHDAFPSGVTGTTYRGKGDEDHASGRAVDYGISGWSGESGIARGTQLAHWARKWHKPLGIHYAIWRDQIWNADRDGEGWRPFVYSGVKAGRVGPTASNRHLNHVHISNYKKGGMVPGIGNSDIMPAMLTPGEFVVNKSAASSIGYGPLKKLNEGGLRSTTTNASGVASDGGVVYNNYETSFVIQDAADADLVADVVLAKFERATRSKVRSR